MHIYLALNHFLRPIIDKFIENPNFYSIKDI